MNKFTPTQGRYLAYIAAYIDGFGQAPAESEIAEALDVSAPSAHQMMKTLAAKGLIRREAGATRSIDLLIDAQDIPKWNGKPPTRVVRRWVQKGPAFQFRPVLIRAGEHTGAFKRGGQTQTVYRFKVVLAGSRPPIWRRIEILDVPLAKLHEAIQTAMGWSNSHLHLFQVDDIRYTDPKMMDDGIPSPCEKSYARLKISDLIEVHGPTPKLTYLYDFGDGWEHNVTLETQIDSQPGVHYPRCTAGARHCPPEDIGGIHGYQNMLQALHDPQHPEHDDFIEWIGDEFDSEAFDLEDINADMHAGLPTY